MEAKEYSLKAKSLAKKLARDKDINSLNEEEISNKLQYELAVNEFLNELRNVLLQANNPDNPFGAIEHIASEGMIKDILGSLSGAERRILDQDRDFFFKLAQEIVDNKEEEEAGNKKRISKILYNAKHFAYVANDIREAYETYFPKDTLPIANYIQAMCKIKLNYELSGEVKGNNPFAELDQILIENNYKDRAIFLQFCMRETVEECKKDYDGYRKWILKAIQDNNHYIKNQSNWFNGGRESFDNLVDLPQAII